MADPTTYEHQDLLARFRCPVCGEPLVAFRHDDGSDTYVCPASAHSASAEPEPDPPATEPEPGPGEPDGWTHTIVLDCGHIHRLNYPDGNCAWEVGHWSTCWRHSKCGAPYDIDTGNPTWDRDRRVVQVIEESFPSIRDHEEG